VPHLRGGSPRGPALGTLLSRHLAPASLPPPRCTRQYLYCCTVKQVNCVPGTAARRSSSAALLCVLRTHISAAWPCSAVRQYLYFCTSNARKLSTSSAVFRNCSSRHRSATGNLRASESSSSAPPPPPPPLAPPPPLLASSMSCHENAKAWQARSYSCQYLYFCTREASKLSSMRADQQQYEDTHTAVSGQIQQHEVTYTAV